MRAVRPRQRGAITLVALCFTAVIGIALASYLALCFRSLDLSSRTVQRERSRHLAEIGLEEALWALNNNTWTGWNPSGANIAQTFNGTSLGQGETSTVAVTVASYATTTPTITAAATTTLPDGPIITTTLQATTKPAPVFGYALASTNGRTRFRNTGTVDSYNSTLGAYGGTNVGYAAVVAGGSTSYTNPVVITNATINGYALTPGNAVSYSTSGKLKGPTTPAGTNIDSNRIGKSVFIPRFSVVAPTGSITDYLPTSFPASPLATGFSSAGLWYSASDYTIGWGQTLTVDGPAKILIDGNLTITSTGRIVVTANGSLELFIRGRMMVGSTVPGDTGGFFNTAPNPPRKLAVFITGTTTNTYSSTASFTGVIYAESSGLDFSSSPTIYGALLTYGNRNFGTSLYPTTSPVIHYDLALRDVVFSGVSTPFIINQLTQQ